MDFSIIIVNYKTPDLTRNCLESIISRWPKDLWEIIVVDNGSGDDSARRLEAEFGADIKLIKNRENLGFARANNQGAKIAGGKYLFFLNSDTTVNDNFLEDWSRRLSGDKTIGLIAPCLLDEGGGKQAKAYGPFPTISYLLYKNLISRRDNDFPKRADWVSGAALAIRHDLFAALGGWDENFFLYLEDVDLSWRVRQAGYRVVRDENARVSHHQGGSPALSREKRQYYFASQDYLFRKYYGRWALIALKILRLPYRIHKNSSNK